MDYQSLIENKLTPQGQSGDEIIYACPKCENPDTGHHLYVNYNREKYHCFHCGLGDRRLDSLLKILSININFDYSKLYTEKDKELDSIIAGEKSEISKSVEYSTDLDVLTEYYRNHIEPLSQRALQYLLDRGLTIDKIRSLCIYEGRSRYGENIIIKGREFIGRDYSGRVMVPSLRKDGRVSFYVARDYIGDKDSKYINPPKELAVASEDVWNLDIVESDSVIICEGVFTAIAASPYKINAVATYGKSIAQKSSNTDVNVTSQGEKLLARKFKNYYVAYDADALAESIKTCQYLYDRGANVKLVRIDPDIYSKKADVADIGYEEFLKLLYSAIPYRGELSALYLK